MQWGTALNSAIKGYDFVDEEMDETRAEKMQQEAITRQHSREDEGDQINRERNQREAETFKRQSRLLDNQEIAEEGKRAWAAYKASGYKVFDQNFARKAKQIGATHWLPEYWTNPNILNSNLRASQTLQKALESKDLQTLNSPEFLADINLVHKDNINQNLGEIHPKTGKRIVKKEIIGFDLAPSEQADTGETGYVIPELKITLEDGTTYNSHSSAGASADPNDPFLGEDIGLLVDDILGRGQMAKAVASNPELMKQINAGEQALGVNAASAYSAQSPVGKLIQDRNQIAPEGPDREYFNTALTKETTPKGSSSSPSTLQKQVEWLQSAMAQKGIELDEVKAIEIIKTPGFDAGAAAAKYLQAKIEEQQDPLFTLTGGQKQSIEELKQEAVQFANLVKDMRQATGNDPNKIKIDSVINKYQGIAPPEAIEYLRQNPSLLPLFEEKYGSQISEGEF